MGKTSRDKTEYIEIEDLFDAADDVSSEYEDIDISSSVFEPVIVGLKDRKLESRLEKPFYPEYDREIVVIGPDDCLLNLPVADIQYLAFVNPPLQFDLQSVNDFSDMLETFAGDSFRIQVPIDRKFVSGFFAVTAEPEDLYKYFYFIYDNIRIQYQLRRLGEIIVQNSMLPDAVLQNVLNKQYQLRKLRLGTIIAKREKLPQRDIENILTRAKFYEEEDSDLHAGDILIKSGIVPPQAVKQSLAVQNLLRRMKVGELLVEMGHLNEEQLSRVLAEKFRRRFVNLQKSSFRGEPFGELSPELARKLKLVPVEFHDNRLVIATSLPDKPEICDILKEKLSTPFELVVAPQKQIDEIMANLPG